MTTKRVAVLAFLTIFCLALPTFAKQAKTVTKGPIVIQESKHDTGPLLREVAPLLPESSVPSQHEIPNNDNPNRSKWITKAQPDRCCRRRRILRPSRPRTSAWNSKAFRTPLASVTANRQTTMARRARRNTFSTSTPATRFSTKKGTRYWALWLEIRSGRDLVEAVRTMMTATRS